MALNSIEHEWRGFSAMVFRELKPAHNQEAEMKKAFFAGAWALFCAVEEMGMPHVSEQECLAFLDARCAECLEFKKRMLAEYGETNLASVT